MATKIQAQPKLGSKMFHVQLVVAFVLASIVAGQFPGKTELPSTCIVIVIISLYLGAFFQRGGVWTEIFLVKP